VFEEFEEVEFREETLEAFEDRELILRDGLPLDETDEDSSLSLEDSSDGHCEVFFKCCGIVKECRKGEGPTSSKL